MDHAPILLFAYKRVEPLKRTVEALKRNFLANQSVLYIYSDGPRSDIDVELVNQVRSYVKTITGFRNVIVIEQGTNKGLANSIIEGVTEGFNEYSKLIILEDDLVTSQNFLIFMNSALDYYENHNNIFSISGFTFPIHFPVDHEFDVYFTKRACSWGWATWKNRWQNIDWSISDYQDFRRDFAARRKFNKMGSDLTGMLEKQMMGKIDSWAIRWCYHQFKSDLFSVYPTRSKILNIGFGETATHTKRKNNSYQTVLDISLKQSFLFDSNVFLNPNVIKKFVSKYGIKRRLISKVKYLIQSF